MSSYDSPGCRGRILKVYRHPGRERPLHAIKAICRGDWQSGPCEARSLSRSDPSDDEGVHKAIPGARFQDRGWKVLMSKGAACGDNPLDLQSFLVDNLQ